MAVSTVTGRLHELPHSHPNRRPAQEYMLASGPITLTDMAAAEATVGRTTELDLTSAKWVQLVVDVTTAGAAGADLRVQYSTDGTNWFEFSTTTDDREVSIDGTGWSASEYMEVPDAARSERCRIRLRGKQGDATADPVLDRVALRVF